MSKGAVLTNVNELEKYSISLPFKLNQPIYNGTINYSTSISNKELGFYLSAIIGKHSIIINDNLYMRNYIIPQAGMRLDF
jgi:hypothetical protein